MSDNGLMICAILAIWNMALTVSLIFHARIIEMVRRVMLHHFKHDHNIDME